MSSIDDRLRALAPLVHVHEHATLLCEAFGGLSRSSLYRALADGSLGIRPIRVGRRLLVRRADLLEVLGISATEPGWVLPQQGTRQRDIGELLLASPAPVVPGADHDEPSHVRCGAAVDEAARRWSAVMS